MAGSTSGSFLFAASRESKERSERGARSQMRRSLSEEPVTRRFREGITMSALTKSMCARVVERCVFVCEDAFSEIRRRLQKVRTDLRIPDTETFVP